MVKMLQTWQKPNRETLEIQQTPESINNNKNISKGASFSRAMEMGFPMFFPLTTTRNTGCYIENQYTKKMKDRENAVDKSWDPGTQGPLVRALMLFSPCTSRTWSWRSWEPGNAHGHRWKTERQNDGHRDRSQRTWKRSAHQDRKPLDDTSSIPVKHHSKVWPHPTPGQQRERRTPTYTLTILWVLG